MSLIRPFRALRPPLELAEKVASPPYDVVSRAEARAIISRNPDSFMRVVRSDAEFPESVDPYAQEIYSRAAENFLSLIQRGFLVQDETPSFYLYTLLQGEHKQTGLMAGTSCREYIDGAIRRHEHTRRVKEDDRARHITTINANSGPVLLTYPADKEIDALVRKCTEHAPVADFQDEAGIHYIVHRVSDTVLVEEFVRLFARIPVLFVADGHHRSAAAVRVCEKRRLADPVHTGKEAYNFFMSLIFPDNQLRILPYNRVVQDLAGRDAAAFLREVESAFHVSEDAAPEPPRRGECSMYLAGRWYGLVPRAPLSGDPLKDLDVSLLQDRLLDPVLGIKDPKGDERIDFVGGSRGTAELVKLVDSGEFAVAFSMFPTSVEELMAVARENGIMPPKSTWFAPKPLSGLIVRSLED